ncbi:MAG: hypothetical protein EBR58_09985 [Betaproteobacteria bacterium]|nr:hypothetical protein [Betaproteobacteria bacterium]
MNDGHAIAARWRLQLIDNARNGRSEDFTTIPTFDLEQILSAFADTLAELEGAHTEVQRLTSIARHNSRT